MTSSDHAKYAPSASERWLRCPGSVARCEGIPNERGTESMEGSYLHEKAEVCLRYGIDPFDLVGEEVFLGNVKYSFTYENAIWLNTGLDWLEEKKPNSEILYETRIITFLEQFGSADVVIYRDRHLTIFDWKFGFYGVRAQDNTQLGLYAAGHIARLKQKGQPVDRVTLAICQPKTGQQVEEATYENLEFFDNLIVEAKAAVNSTKIVPGPEQCMFCPARFSCGEYRDYVMELIELMIKNEKRHINLSDHDIEKIFVNKKLIADLTKKVEAEALHRLESGVQFKDIDLAEGRLPVAEWTKDEGEIVSYFTSNTLLRESELYNSTLKTPTQVLELLGKTQPEKVKLISENSKRGTSQKRVVPRFAKGKRVSSIADAFNDF